MPRHAAAPVCSRTNRALRALALILVWPPLAAAAQETAAAPPELAAELARLNRNVERIAALVERSLESDRLALLLQRISIAAGRLGPLEEEIRSTRASLRGLEEEEQRILMRLEAMANRIEEAEPELVDDNVRIYADEMDTQLTILRGQRRSTEARLVELENQLASRQAEIVDWQDFVDRELTDFR